jgi:hypothetical protein
MPSISRSPRGLSRSLMSPITGNPCWCRSRGHRPRQRRSGESPAGDAATGGVNEILSNSRAGQSSMVCREASLEFGQCVWPDQRHISRRKVSFYHFKNHSVRVDYALRNLRGIRP